MAGIRKAADWLWEGKPIFRKGNMNAGEYITVGPDGFLQYNTSTPTGVTRDGVDFELSDFFSKDWEVFDGVN